ncbi:MAG: helix-turn-helix transcriptional regulator [Bacteroidetes bacterium]|nr:helix-turn-helix transcriptional regulator [Bacteroidota bacterium]
MENDKQYEPKLQELANMLDALSHPARLQIIEHLSEYHECPAGAISDKLPICKSTVSQHLTKLKETGFILCNPSDGCQNYKLNEDRINYLKHLVGDFISRISTSAINKNSCKNIKIIH